MANLSKKVIDALNFRIEQEELSSRLYFSMGVYLDNIGYSGAAKLLYKYAEEEAKHAKIAYDFQLDLDILPIVPPLKAVQTDFSKEGLSGIIDLIYEHELLITKQCNDLWMLGMKENCALTVGKAQWYCNEQVEEIKKATYWVNRRDLFGTDKIALRMLDNEMGE